MLEGEFELVNLRINAKNDLGKAIFDKSTSYMRDLLGSSFIEDLTDAKADLETLLEAAEEILSNSSNNTLKTIVAERIDIANAITLNTNSGCLLTSLFYFNSNEELKAINSARGVLPGEVWLNGISQKFGVTYLKSTDIRYSRMSLSELEKGFTLPYFHTY